MSPVFDVPAIRSRAIARPRLVRQLGIGANRAHLAIVHGAAGGGKSTLLAQWAKSLPHEGGNLAWVTLNPDDAGLLPFWNRVGSALVRNDLISADSPFDALSRPRLHERALRALFVDIFGTLSAPLTIVLDDYHAVASDSIDSQLRLLVETVDGVSLVIGSRATSGLHAVEVAARLKTVLLDADALAFTLDESTTLVAESELGENTELACTIQEASLGWPLAIQGLLIEAQRDPGSKALLVRITGERSRFVTEFVRSQLAVRTAESREFLLRIALANECTVALAAELSGQSEDEAAQHLDQFEREGIGTWQVRNGTSWFRLHPLLQESLEQEAATLLERETLDNLRGLLSDRLRHTRPLRALELAFAISDWQRLEDLVLLRWLAFSYYQREAFITLLRRVPRAAMTAHPALLAAELAHDYGTPASLTQLTTAFATVATLTGPDYPATDVVGALRETMTMGVHRLFGDMPTALHKADRAHAALAASTLDDRHDNAAAVPILHVQSAITHLIDGQYNRALDEVSRGRELAIEVGSVGEQFQALAVSALTSAVRGDIRSADEWIARCEQADPYDGWLGGYLQAGYHIAKAISALNRWDADDALRSLSALDAQESVIEYWPYIAMARAQADLILFGPGEAHAAFSETLTRKHWRPRSPLAAQLLATKAQLLLHGGQTARADKVLRQSGLAGHPEIDVVRARLAGLQSKDESAIALADSVVWASDENPRLRVEALLAIAVASYKVGNINRASESTVRAVSTLDRYDLRLPLLTVRTERLHQLFATAQAQGKSIDERIIADAPIVAVEMRTVESLSAAEKRVLRSLLDHSDLAEVAESLHLSVHTVRYHLKRGYRKLGVNKRSEAIAVAQELGMLDD